MILSIMAAYNGAYMGDHFMEGHELRAYHYACVLIREGL